MLSRAAGHLGPIFAILLALGGCDRHPAAAVIEPATETTSVGPQKIHAGDLDLLEVLTPGARESDTLPMVVAVHGMGDRPENWLDFFATFPEPARIYLPRAPEKYGDGGSWFTYPPKSAEDLAAGIAQAGGRVAAAIAELAKTKTRGKPILTGFSQGGFVSFDVAVHHPDVIDAAFPMSGGLPEGLYPHTENEARLTAPLFATHGTADRMVPIAMSRDAVAKIVSLGGNATLEEFPGAPHTITPAMHEEILKRIAARLHARNVSGDGG